MPNDRVPESQFVELPQSSLVDQVKDKLLAAIASGELAPGERVVEAELACEFPSIDDTTERLAGF